MSNETKVITPEELAKHNSEDSAWLSIDGNVYDVTSFAGMHPGGEEILYQYAGKDVTEDFYGLHRIEVLKKYNTKLKIGTLKGGPTPVTQDAYDNANKTLSKVPYAEPSAFQGFPSPYYKESHHAFRKNIRAWIETNLRPEAEDNEEDGDHPSDEAQRACGKIGLLGAFLGEGEHMDHLEEGLPGISDLKEFDYFHELIAHEEMGRLGLPSYVDGIRAGYVIGASPVWKFGPEWMKKEIGIPVVRGEKRICLAISEPFAGSDVAGLKTTAIRSPCGEFYIVNGTKKWITGGVFADYFCTAVRTGKGGAGGISMLLIPRMEGVNTKPIKTSYSSCAGTSYITFENVKVPVKYLLGQENRGFALVMYNFNHERWFIIAGFIATMRYTIEESMKWARQRKVFGKALIESPVIRIKFAKILGELEAVYSWLESITFQMTQMSQEEYNQRLGGQIALLKFQCTRIAHSIADDTVQIFGGRGITKTGMGKNIERFERTYKYAAILGGSEEIMADLGIKQAMRSFPSEGARL